jgi:hypothetical protein
VARLNQCSDTSRPHLLHPHSHPTDAVVGALGEHALVFVIEQCFKDLAGVDIGGCGSGSEEALGFQVGLHVVFFDPTCFAVFLATPVGWVSNYSGGLPFLTRWFVSRSLRWHGASTKLASTMLPSRATMPPPSSDRARVSHSSTRYLGI